MPGVNESSDGVTGGRSPAGKRRAPARRKRSVTREDPRSRLMAAELELVGEQGYAATTVADVIARAGASRKTFYEHFGDRQACFFAVSDEIARDWQERVRDSLGNVDTAAEAMGAFVGALFDASAESPAALHVLMAELTAAGNAGIVRRERLLRELGRMLGEALEGLADEDGSVDRGFRMPAEEDSLLVRALLGALLRSAHARAWRNGRLRRLRRSEMEALAGDAAQWAATFRIAPEPQVAPLSGNQHVPIGGRAPGTLSLEWRASNRRGLPRGDSDLPRSFVVHNQRERLLDALVNLSAAKGYWEVTIPDIVQEAAVSVQAFYEHFSSKEEAFNVAYELGQRKLLAIVERAYDVHPQWPDGVHSGVNALLDFLASEPSFARVSLVDALTAGSRVSTLAQYGSTRLAHLIRPGLDYVEHEAQRVEMMVEGTVNAVQALCHTYAARERTREMASLVGLAVHIALVPFLPDRVRELQPSTGRSHASSSD